jgi:RNA polymerase sigma factor (sigma-70 family)
VSASNSVTRWIEQLKGGDQAAATLLWQRYFERLVRMAHLKLRNAPRRIADEEDVVSQAFESLFRRAGQGRFPHLHDRHDFWHLLVKIAERKALNQRRYELRQKRDGGRVRGESVFDPVRGSTAQPGLDQLPGGGPTPELAAAVAEAVEMLLGLLSGDLRRIALLKLEGDTNEEIAEKIGRSVATVERRLKLIRDEWEAVL